WIVEEQTSSGRSSRHKKITVTACSACGGVGKTRCSACDGMGGQPCKRCKGDGYTQKKVK
ncbi:MAG: molecular chaperone DnaJ, partial [Kiritimatiellae bacterium]|nr:molecular chaperone DnaJ [Kiritimatiellia bacterium]